MKDIQIGHLTIGLDSPPFIIAELSGNHSQSLSKALKLVDAAADAGAHALKLQTYTPDTITIDVHTDEFFIDNPESLWQGCSLYELYKKAMTPWEWHKEIFAHAQKRGLIAFSTPFDNSAVDFLETLDVPCYKIASFENVDHGLLKRVAQTKKPVIMSNGMATEEELGESVALLRSLGVDDLILLKCTSNYPAEPLEANLQTLPYLMQRYNCPVGLSDHTLGLGTSIASIALGARVIEKHFVLNRADKDIDGEFSLEPAEMAQLVIESKRAWQSLGTVQRGPTKSELPSLRHRRSLYVVADLNPGDTLTTQNVRSIRPGLGLAPKHLDSVIGKKVRVAVKRGTALSFELLE